MKLLRILIPCCVLLTLSTTDAMAGGVGSSTEPSVMSCATLGSIQIQCYFVDNCKHLGVVSSPVSYSAEQKACMTMNERYLAWKRCARAYEVDKSKMFIKWEYKLDSTTKTWNGWFTQSDKRCN